MDDVVARAFLFFARHSLALPTRASVRSTPHRPDVFSGVRWATHLYNAEIASWGRAPSSQRHAGS